MAIRRPAPVEREEEEVWRSRAKMGVWNQRVVSRLLTEDCLGPGLRVDSAKFQVTFQSHLTDQKSTHHFYVTVLLTLSSINRAYF